jgi:hypothetical protein
VKTMFLDFEDHLNVGVSSTKAPNSAARPKLEGHANRAWPALAHLQATCILLYLIERYAYPIQLSRKMWRMP